MTKIGLGRSSNERKQARRNRYKQILGGICVQCGATEDLEFDHKDPKTKTVRYLWNQSNEFLDAEMALLQLLCPTCHQAKTSTEKAWLKYPLSEKALAARFKKKELIHGTHTGRYQYGCKCTPCHKAYNWFDLAMRHKDQEYIDLISERLSQLRAGANPEEWPLPVPRNPGRKFRE